MPQARRKTPFSGKAKKQQLQNKKQNKTLLLSSGGGTTSYDELCPGPRAHGRGGRADAGRYALKFYRETDEELKIKKEDALRAVTPLPPSSLEVQCAALFPPALAFPRRPPWDFSMSAAELDAQEHRYFKEYIQKLQSSEHWKHISYFELNLETWRQLWRVLEMCDILLLVADVRYAGMMFPPSLYEHVVKDQGKDMILVLNKVDLVPASVVAAWRQYFLAHCPGLRVVYFTSCPGYNLHGAQGDKAGLVVRRRKGRQRMCVEGATQLVDACEDAAGGRVSLQGWRNKVKEEADQEYDDDEEPQVGETVVEKADTSFYQHERYKNGILTIGCVGSPNAGKSSLINALMGKKVVSVSKTPGHTKHFQTIFLTPQVRLCDCPGLVFPSVVSRPAQILMGCYPIAQLREPYTTIRFMAERLNLPKLLRIQHPEGDDSWSPRDICDGWAKKRGYLTAKAARLDTYRAANSLLRMALDGKLCLWLAPPAFTADREKYETCEEIKYIKWVQALASEDSADQRSSPVDQHSSSGSGEEQDSGTDEEESDASDGEHLQAMANKFAALAGDD